MLAAVALNPTCQEALRTDYAPDIQWRISERGFFGSSKYAYLSQVTVECSRTSDKLESLVRPKPSETL